MNDLSKVWERKWQDAGQREPLTLLGRCMFRQKKKILNEVVPNLNIKTVIDAGCGLGYTTEVLRRLGLDYLGIDVSESAVKACRTKGLSAQLKGVEDVVEQYDLVFSDGMLEHFLNMEPYIGYLARISRQYVLLIQPNHTSFWGMTLVYLSRLLRRDKNVFEYNYRIEDFIAKFAQNDYTIVKNIPVFFDVFRLLLFKKK